MAQLRRNSSGSSRKESHRYRLQNSSSYLTDAEQTRTVHEMEPIQEEDAKQVFVQRKVSKQTDRSKIKHLMAQYIQSVGHPNSFAQSHDLHGKDALLHLLRESQPSTSQS